MSNIFSPYASSRLAFSLSILFLVVSNLGAQAGPARPSSPAQQPVRVQVRTAEVERVSDQLSYAGRIEPRGVFGRRAPNAGVVESVQLRVGQAVREGDTVLSIRRDQPGREFLPVPVQSRHTGVIADLQVVVGQEVREGDELYTVADTGAFIARLLISDKDIDALRVGLPVQARDPSSGASFPARIDRVGLIPDYRTGLFPVELSLRPASGLIVGRFLRFEFDVRPTDGVLVPYDALTRRGERSYVFVVENGEARLREVQTAGEYAGRVLVSSGLSAGEGFVVSSDRRLTDGRSVQVER